MKLLVSRSVLALFVATSLLGGCSTLKKFTGQRNDTVLPGDRENILTPDQQVNNDVAKHGAKTADGASADVPAPCDPKVEVCPENQGGTEDGIDQEASGN